MLYYFYQGKATKLKNKNLNWLKQENIYNFIGSTGIFVAKGWHLGVDIKVFLMMAEVWVHLLHGYLAQEREGNRCIIQYSAKISVVLVDAMLSACDTKINVSGSLLVWGLRVDSLQKGQLRSLGKRRGRGGDRVWSKVR